MTVSIPTLPPNLPSDLLFVEAAAPEGALAAEAPTGPAPLSEAAATGEFARMLADEAPAPLSPSSKGARPAGVSEEAAATTAAILLWAPVPILSETPAPTPGLPEGVTDSSAPGPAPDTDDRSACSTLAPTTQRGSPAPDNTLRPGRHPASPLPTVVPPQESAARATPQALTQPSAENTRPLTSAPTPISSPERSTATAIGSQSDPVATNAVHSSVQEMGPAQPQLPEQARVGPCMNSSPGRIALPRDMALTPRLDIEPTEPAAFAPPVSPVFRAAALESQMPDDSTAVQPAGPHGAEREAATATAAAVPEFVFDPSRAGVGLRRFVPQEKIAPAREAGILPPAAKAQPDEKTFVSAAQQAVRVGEGIVGTGVAQKRFTMSATSAAPATVAEPVSVQPGSALFAPESRPLVFDLPASATPAEQARSLVATVLVAVDAQERLAAGGNRAVNLSFNLGEEQLAVRVEFRAGTVHAHFHASSPELRSALAQEWQHAAAAPENVLRLAEPVFTAPARTEQPAAFSADGGAARQQQQQQHTSAEAAEMLSLRSAAAPSARGAAATALPEAPGPHLQPQSLHLQAVA
jgi:hypothetical protein